MADNEETETTITIRMPEENGIPLYDTSTFTFHQGINVLVGCNGSGKTTLMKSVGMALRKREGAVTRLFSTVTETSDAPGALLLSSDEESLTLAATMLCSSEGERMAQTLRSMFQWMGRQMLAEETKEIWMMLDSADSGLDIPTIRVVKEVLRDVTADAQRDGITVFVLMSTNGYAIAEGEEHCLDVSTGKHISFGNWDEYADFCVASDKAKGQRYDRIIETLP